MPASHPTPSAPIRVLVCDDAADIRALFRLELEADGDIAVVGLAGGGEEAIAIARRERPHVALVDLELPGLPGLETIALLHAERLAGAILVVSGSADPAAAGDAASRGAAGFVSKRTPAAELRAAVRQVAPATQAADRDCR